MWIAFALMAAILWGLNYTLAERVLQNISVFTLLALEMLIGTVVFSVLAWCTSLKKDLHALVSHNGLLWITLAEIIIVTLASYLIVISIRSKNATAAAIIELVYPLFTVFFTWILFRENHANSSVLIGGALVFAGVFMLGK